MTGSKKLLLIMRHAKSDKNFQGPDFDRPLDDEGEKQPSSIASALNHRGISLDQAVISPAMRTAQTWHLLQAHLDFAPQPDFERHLYLATLDDFLGVLEQTLSFSTTLVIAHAPGVNHICEFLTGQVVDFMPAHLAILSTGLAEKNVLKKPGRFTFESLIRP